MGPPEKRRGGAQAAPSSHDRQTQESAEDTPQGAPSQELDFVALMTAGDRLFIRWFCQAGKVRAMLNGELEADDVVVVDTPALRIELSLHETGAEARAAAEELKRDVALSVSTPRGRA
jgi:hypothetical protein